MSYLDQLPGEVANLIRTAFVAEFATVSAAGVPIDTPLVTFTSEDEQTVDAGTGLAYPAKAERARRNPKTGLLFEGGPNGPVVSIAGMSAVRDADLQANLDRYVSEQILAPYMSPDIIDYDSITRHAIWYFTRVLICVKPARVRWWPNPAAMDEAPSEWHAPVGTIFPPSDPAPPGAASKAPWRPQDSWQSQAEGALARKAPGHLTLLDEQGFPLPIRALEVHGHPEGFRLVMPKWLPWPGGVATLTFGGIETFVGTAEFDRGEALLRVERAMPILPMMMDPREVLQPRPATRTALLERLDHELKRRGMARPVMPAEPPEPTAGARLRDETARAFHLSMTAAGT